MFRRKEGDRFEREVLRHLGAAYNLARWLLGNDEDAEDAVQEACLRALRGISGARGEVKPWFLAIVRNTCMNHIRAQKRHQGVSTDENQMLSAPDSAPLPDEAVEVSYNAERLRCAMESLPPDWKEVIILREFEQMGYQEIADVIAAPVGTVMSRLSRARRGLAELLSKEVANEM